MATRTVVDHSGIFLITFTCHSWLPLIHLSDAYADVYRFFDVLKEKGQGLVGYVIMPNHVHFLLNYQPGGQTLNTLIGNEKRFLAYSIVKKLEQKNQLPLLQQLIAAVQAKDRSRGKQHEVWKPGFDVKPCRTEKYLLQKLNYIHDNPVRGKWKLAMDNASYEHSSCRFYFERKQGHCDVTHYEEVLDWENMYE